MATARRSLLVPVGIALIAQQFLGGSIALDSLARASEPPWRQLFFIATDLARAAFFVGIGCLIIGLVRNRRWKKEAQTAAQAQEKVDGSAG